jgi:putative tryptophan/tyrosine transport system substrate-binding protein
MRESCKYGSVRGAGSDPRPYRNRREFIAGLGSATAWPVVARAQQGDPVRRIGVLIFATENDPIFRAGMAAFRLGLQQLGWVEGRNLRVDLRFATDPDLASVSAAELVRIGPDVIVTYTAPFTRAVEEQTQTIPIVFIAVGDGFGPDALVRSVAHPEGNMTGVDNFYGSMSSKWLEFLKEAAPRVERVGIVYNAQSVTASRLNTLLSLYEEAARMLALQAIRIQYRNATDLMRVIDAFAVEPNGGLVMPFPLVVRADDRETIVRLAIQHRLPLAGTRETAVEGGLIGYGPNTVDLFRRAPFYVDRILRGAKVRELPVAYPTKLELVINLKTAKALGLTIKEALLATADEVIQ